MKIFYFKCLYFLEKYSMIFQNSLIKSLINKIKKHKNFYNFLTGTDTRNWKYNVKNIKRIKKQIVNHRILEKKLFHISILF